ncbi:hypothetical protein [Legionella feeleii]|nr:hypothetical protein [Legionella feeleii]
MHAQAHGRLPQCDTTRLLPAFLSFWQERLIRCFGATGKSAGFLTVEQHVAACLLMLAMKFGKDCTIQP